MSAQRVPGFMSVLVACILGLAACGSLPRAVSPPQKTPPGRSHGLSSTQEAALTYGQAAMGGLNGYAHLRRQDQNIAAVAQYAVMDRCLIAHGMTTELITQRIEIQRQRVSAIETVASAERLPPQQEFHPGPLGINSMTIARRYGYSDPWSRVEHTLTAGPQPAVARSFPADAYIKAQNACGSAAQFLTAKIQHADLLASLAEQVQSQAMASPAVTKALAAWSACMRARGFGYSSPVGRQGSPTWVYDQSGVFFLAPSAANIATAVADVSCKQRTGLVSGYVRAAQHYAGQYAQRYAGQLAAYQASLQSLVATAEKALAEPQYRGMLGLAEQEARIPITVLDG